MLASISQIAQTFWWPPLLKLRMTYSLGLMLGVILVVFGVGYWDTLSTRTQALSFIDAKVGLLLQVSAVRTAMSRSRDFETDVILFTGDNTPVTASAKCKPRATRFSMWCWPFTK